MINNSFGAILFISVLSVVIILIFSMLKTNLPIFNISIKQNKKLIKKLYLSEIILGVIVISIFAGYLFHRSTIMFAVLFLLLVMVIIFIGLFFLKDYIAGLIIKSSATFVENDIVEFENQQGKIINLTKRAVVLLNSDGDKIFIPYSKIISNIKTIKGAKDTINTGSFTIKCKTPDDINKLTKTISNFIASLPWVSTTLLPDITFLDTNKETSKIKITVYYLDAKYLQKIDNSVREMFEEE